MITPALLPVCSIVYGGCLVAARGSVWGSTLPSGASFISPPVIRNPVVLQRKSATESDYRAFRSFARPLRQHRLHTTGVMMKQQSVVQACGFGALMAVSGVLIPRMIPAIRTMPLLAPTSAFWLTRSVFLRCLGGIFSIAFTVALFQNKALIGDKGVTPARAYLRRVLRNGFNGDRRRAAQRVPTLFWLISNEIRFSARGAGQASKLAEDLIMIVLYTAAYVSRAALDPWLDATAAVGLVLSIFVTLLGAANVPIMISLWVLYHTLVNVGQHWYGFGWESQLLETAFLTAFAVPLFSMRPFAPACPPPTVMPWLYRWLGFRIMLGAGLIKIRGDKVWKDLTAMDYHYETQPLPNPISYYLHHAPKKMHRFETAVNHVVELGASWLLLAPVRFLSMLGGGIQALFQLAIIISGNLSFLNYLTILPFIWCFDDRALAWMFSDATRSMVASMPAVHPSIPRSAASWFVFGLVAWLSTPVVRNMASKKQTMNRTFEPYRLVNTYGAFGSVSKFRPEIVIKGTLKLDGENTAWREYEFRSKPGPLSRSLPWVSPYHRRLDWCLWIAALGPSRSSVWFPRLLLKLMENDTQVSSLLKTNPFLGTGEAPKYIKADLYRYSFTKINSEERRRGQIWKRRLLCSFWDVSTRESLLRGMLG